MKRLVAKLRIVYACLMKLYPVRYKRAFGDERQEVFILALEEAIQQGYRALFRLALDEMHDFPVSVIRAYYHEWKVIMKTTETKIGDERLSLIGLLLGIWPFLVSGPVMAILPYLPWPAEKLFSYNSPLWLVIIGFSLLIGIFVGWKKGFPRWVYPYLVVFFYAIVIPLVSWLGQLVRVDINGWISTVLFWVAILGLGAAALFSLSSIPATRKIYDDVRNDWTRLSFGMVVFLALGTGIYLGDHPRPFGPTVWLPSVIVFLGTIAYLFCCSRLTRSMALIATIVISILFNVVLPTDDPWVVEAIFILVALIFSPALVELFPRHNLPQTNEN